MINICSAFPCLSQELSVVELYATDYSSVNKAFTRNDKKHRIACAKSRKNRK